MGIAIEITDNHRAALLELAARRQLKGFSELVEEAIALYLQTQAERDETLSRALRARGALAAAEAEELRQNVQSVRDNWRCWPRRLPVLLS